MVLVRRSSMRSLTSALMAVLVVGAAPSEARACDCKPTPPPVEALAKSDVVFEGRAGKPTFDDDHQRVPFEVVRVYKGDPGPQVVVWTSDSDASCGRFYDEGKRYLVYTWASGGELWDGLCSRTRSTEDAKEDLALFGPGEEPHPHPTRETESLEPDAEPAPSAPPKQPAEPVPPAEPAPTSPHPSGGCAASVAGGARSPIWLWCLVFVSLRRRGARASTRRTCSGCRAPAPAARTPGGSDRHPRPVGRRSR